ncbi:hypothetical protein M514_06721 [Trichuris suis]|uniref:DUF19 domain-containing protein n=1 Tax=Trichuris suis TaxID=68888 RepID=A0A085M544_9BILA|nr:hypothetical protein M513_06721 [Trichuris suis]KFD69927.1 hypothetical protein M514_06721 [Trichuris suis]
MTSTGNRIYVAIAFAATILLSSAEESEFFKFLPFNNAFDSFKRLFNLQPTNTEQQVQTVQSPPPSQCQAMTGPIAALLMKTCHSQTATKTGFIWGSRLRELFASHDSYDLGKGITSGLRETCEQMAQSQACDQLSAHLAKCDVAGGIASFIGFVQAKQRCKKLSNFFTNSENVRKNVGGLLSNEFVGGLMQKFIG